MAHVNWKGVYPALTTKFTSHDELDLPLFQRHVTEQIAAGVHGIILAGSLGEASTLSIDEKQQLVEAALETVEGKIPVILNIAEGSTKEAIRAVELARQWGVSGLMLLPPMRYRTDEQETIEFFSAVAKSTNLPIMIYNNPVDYRIEVSLDMFEVLCKIENVQAVKESTRDITNVTRMINRFSDRLQILCGVDTLALEELVLGADGWVAGLVNAFPRETMLLYQLAKEERLSEARVLYRWFMPLLELDIHPKLVQYIKLAEAEVGIGTEYVRAPRLTLMGRERERILGIIRKAIESKPAATALKMPDQVAETIIN